MKRITGQIILLAVLGLSLSLLSSYLWAEGELSKEPVANPSPVKKKIVKKRKSAKSASSTTLAGPEKTETKKKSSVQVWLTRMKKKLASAENKSKNNKLVAVAAVRGDESPDSPPLYWKGKTKDEPVTLPELKEFDDAVNLALEGNNTDAKSKLEAFVSSYPTSPLKDDAQQTLQMLNEESVAP